MGVAIKIENLSKQYQLGTIGTGTLSHDLNRFFAKIRGKEDPFLKIGETNDRAIKGTSDLVWALKDINFEVNQGEILGIIGKNGAGKSTLLKILSKVTGPTTGSIKAKGRIASLLEVGTGFHPELTGRENIFLNGAILGMTKFEIKSKLDEIVDFAGIERYLDTPVKRYSSGMMVRLGFAIAAHLEPEILVVDEVLAVGDAEFQKKAIGKMQDVSQNHGRTVLFVSHDMNAISNLTNRSILLQNGRIIANNITSKVINQYLDIYKSMDSSYLSKKTADVPHVKSIEIKTSMSNYIHECSEPFTVEFTLQSPRPIKDACFSFQIVDSKERNFVHQWLFDADMEYLRNSGEYKLICTIPSLRLYKGKYFIKCYLSESTTDNIETIENVCPFEIVMYKVSRSKFAWGSEACAYIEDSNWEIK